MDLRKRPTHLLAATGALLIVGSLSLSGVVAVAVPSPAADDDQATTTVPGPPATVAPAETSPTRKGTGTVSEGGVSDPVTDSLLDPGVSGTGLDRAESPAPVRGGRQLGETGDGTRRLVLVGGVALLLGALVVAFTGRERSALKSPALPAGPAVRHPRRSRRELDGWEDGVPLAPAKRELARHRLGISAGGLRDDEPGA